MSFPITRLRRLRTSETIRSMVREHALEVNDFIYPLFVCEGANSKKEIGSMPGNFQMSVDLIVKECEEVFKLGIPAVLLFGIPAYKDEIGSSSWQEDGIIQKATRAIKASTPELLVVADVCLCEYTSHGHCGELCNGYVDNDATLKHLAKQALSYAQAGVDIIAPSDMMDGRIAEIRETLDNAGFINIPILSYAAKYASGFYGPFREAAESAPQFGDRKTYQMDPANSMEAMREIEQDVIEGADMIMVKPALSYLDIITQAKQNFNLPVVAYNVSGEYSMVMAAAEKGWIDGPRVMMEILLSIKRAGADMIITYHAKEAAKLLNKNKM